MPRAPEVPSPSEVESTTRFGTRAVLAAAALSLVAVPFSLTLLLVVNSWPPLMRSNDAARDRLHGFAVSHPWFVDAMQLISDVGSAMTWQIMLTAIVVWLLWRRLPRLAAFVVITAVGSSMLNAVVKAAVHRPRPVLADPVAYEAGLSFPSGHAQAAIVGYALLATVFLPIAHGAWRQIAATSAILMVLAIGFSRIALGVHYVSDVVGGYALGAAWVTAMAAAFGVLQTSARTTVPSHSMKAMDAIQIRSAGPADAPFLTSMLVEAASFCSDRHEDPAVVLRDPQVAQYIAGWPRDRDRGLVATTDHGVPLGACWLRYRPVSSPGYGFVAPDIPEITLGVCRDARGRGIGRALLRAIAAEAAAEGVTTLSLSVEHANHVASGLYRSEGWRVVTSETDADTMVLDLESLAVPHD